LYHKVLRRDKETYENSSDSVDQMDQAEIIDLFGFGSYYVFFIISVFTFLKPEILKYRIDRTEKTGCPPLIFGLQGQWSFMESLMTLNLLT
jgi:hypothetical protein